jgi:hypothetical protein
MADKSEPKQTAPSTPSNAATAPAPPTHTPVTAPIAPTSPAAPKGKRILLPLQLTVRAARKGPANIDVDCVITDGENTNVQSLSLSVDKNLSNSEVETILQEAISQLASKLYQADKTAFVSDTAPLGDLVGLHLKGSVTR